MRSFALLGFLATSTACPKKNESPMPSTDNDLRRALLDTLLQQPTVASKTFGEALLNHGSILPEELPHLTTAAGSANPIVRKNAVYLIAKIQTPEALAVLRRLATDSDDAQVFVLAVDGLRKEVDGKRLAATRSALAHKAMIDPDPTVQSAAVRVGWLSGDPSFLQEMEKRLHSPLPPVRDAVTAILAANGAGPLERTLKEILLHPSADVRYGYADIYQALAQSDDPTMGDVFLRSLDQASVDLEMDFLNGIALSKSRKPWLKELLLTLARQDIKIRWSAFARLAIWGTDAPETELLAICVQELERRIPKDPAAPTHYEIQLESCRSYLSTLAQRPFDWGDLRPALEFAKKRLSATK